VGGGLIVGLERLLAELAGPDGPAVCSRDRCAGRIVRVRLALADAWRMEAEGEPVLERA
jgi:hypothetical protein